MVWVLAGDEVRLGFLTAAGFAPDGAERTFDAGAGEPGAEGAGSDADGADGAGSAAELREVRLVASLVSPA